MLSHSTNCHKIVGRTEEIVREFPGVHKTLNRGVHEASIAPWWSMSEHTRDELGGDSHVNKP